MNIQPFPIEDFAKKSFDFLENYVPFHKNEVFVAGGFFPRFYHNIPIRDIDVYVKKGHFKNAAKEYKNWGTIISSGKYYEKYKSPYDDDITIELIGFHEPNNQKFVETFDLSICMFALCDPNIKLLNYYSPVLMSTPAGLYTGTFKDIQNKQMHFNENCTISWGHNNNHIISRVIKYLNLGFTIEPDQLTRIHQKLIMTKQQDCSYMY